jgi:hypothetical protein
MRFECKPASLAPDEEHDSVRRAFHGMHRESESILETS